MSEDAYFVVSALAIALLLAIPLAIWLFRISATALAWFTGIVLLAPWWIVVPGFIIFPPAFVAFLVGLALLAIGDVGDDGRWRSNRYWRRVGVKPSKYRQSLGYTE